MLDVDYQTLWSCCFLFLLLDLCCGECYVGCLQGSWEWVDNTTVVTFEVMLCGDMWEFECFLSMCLFVLCVLCLTVLVNCLLNVFAICVSEVNVFSLKVIFLIFFGSSVYGLPKGMWVVFVIPMCHIGR